jgi:hypothetical protein
VKIYQSSSKTIHKKEEEDRTSDWSILGRVGTRKSQKENKGFFLKGGGIERKIRGEGGNKFYGDCKLPISYFLWVKR